MEVVENLQLVQNTITLSGVKPLRRFNLNHGRFIILNFINNIIILFYQVVKWRSTRVIFNFKLS